MSSKLVILWRCQFCKKLSILYYIAGWVPLLLPGRHRVPGEFWPLCNIREGEIAINSDPFPPVVHGARGENTLENATVHNELYQKTLISSQQEWLVHHRHRLVFPNFKIVKKMLKKIEKYILKKATATHALSGTWKDWIWDVMCHTANYYLSVQVSYSICRDQFSKKNSGEKTYQKSSKQVIINTNSSKPGKIAASSIGVTVHQTVFVCQWSWMVSGRTDKSSYDSADREDSLWLQREEGLRLWSILRMTMPSETPISNSTNTEADLLPSVPRRVIQVWKHTGVSV